MVIEGNYNQSNKSFIDQTSVILSPKNYLNKI